MKVSVAKKSPYPCVHTTLICVSTPCAMAHCTMYIAYTYRPTWLVREGYYNLLAKLHRLPALLVSSLHLFQLCHGSCMTKHSYPINSLRHQSVPHALSISFILIQSREQYLVRSTNHEATHYAIFTSSITLSNFIH